MQDNTKMSVRTGLSFTLLILIALLINIIFMYQKISVITTSQNNLLESTNTEITKLSAGIGYQENRARLVLFMQKKILEEGCKIDKNKAFQIASDNYEIAKERFHNIDPLFVLANQWKESRFYGDTCSKGPNGEDWGCGLNQVTKPTAITMYNWMGMTYNPLYISDTKENTIISCKFLSLLFNTYSDPKKVLIDYQCGYGCSERFPYKELKSDGIVKKAVDKTIKKYEQYKIEFSKFKINIEIGNINKE